MLGPGVNSVPFFVKNYVGHSFELMVRGNGLNIPGHCSTREQRSIYGLSGTQRLRMILYADDIAVLCNNADELAEILRIYDKTFTRFGLKIATDNTKTMAFNVPEEIKCLPSLFHIMPKK